MSVVRGGAVRETSSTIFCLKHDDLSDTGAANCARTLGERPIFLPRSFPPETNRWHHARETTEGGINFSIEPTFSGWIFATAYLPRSSKPMGYEIAGLDFPTELLCSTSFRISKSFPNSPTVSATRCPAKASTESSATKFRGEPPPRIISLSLGLGFLFLPLHLICESYNAPV
jgi:hypothetical protein